MRRVVPRIARTFLVSLVALAGCKKEDAQPAFAAISGTITDELGGAPLGNVLVRATSPSNSGNATTDAQGKYRVQNLLAGVDYAVVATSVDYEPKNASVKTVEGENTLDLVLRRGRVCTPQEKHCAIAPAPAAVLVCNDAGTGYSSTPCGQGEVCDPSTTVCAVPSVLTVEITAASTGDGVVTSQPSGIHCPPDCDEAFMSGQMVTLTAEPGPESSFANYGGVCLGMTGGPNRNQCVVTTGGTQLARVQFNSASPPLTVVKSGSGMGTVRSEPPGIDCGMDCAQRYATNLNVRLTATPARRSTFEGWMGCDMVPMPNVCEFRSTMARTVRARFEAFYLSPLTADAQCLTLLHFDAPMRYAQGCGGGSDAVVTGTVSYPASRSMALGTAVEQGGLSEEGAIDTMKRGVSGAAATVEMTIYRIGNAFENRGEGVLYSDRSSTSSTAGGLRFGIADDGRLFAETHDTSGMSTRVESPAGAIMMATWTHVAVTASAMNGLHLFVEGAEVGATAAPLSFTASSSTAWVGAEREDGAGGAIYRFNGRIDELRVSSNARY